MKAFLDTNILVDVILKREPFATEAETILTMGSKGKILLFASTLSVATMAYLLKKTDTETRKEILSGLFSFVSLLPSKGEHVSRALKSDFADLEDALQYEASLEEPCDIIITRNIKDFACSSIPVLSPSEFLRYCGKP